MSGIEAAFFGTLGRDAEVKISKAGKSYMRLSVRIGNDEGAQWVNVLAFDPSAVGTAPDFRARVYVEGSPQLNEWTTQDGAKRAGLQVMSWHARLTQIGRNRPRKRSAAERGDPMKPSEQLDPALGDSIPF